MSCPGGSRGRVHVELRSSQLNDSALQTQELGCGITCIDTGYMRPGMAACYLLQHDGCAAFIETGVNRNVPGLLELLDIKGIAREQVTHIMPTHVHLDHAGGAGALMQALPEAKLVIHPRGARHMIDPSKLIAGVSAVYGEENFARLYGELVPIDEDRIILADDGFTLDFNGRILEFMDTPGHARHHYCVFDPVSNGVFTGDTMGLSYPELSGPNLFALATTTPVQFDPGALHASINRIMDHRPERLFLTHFGMVTDVKSLADQLHRDIDEYVTIVDECEDPQIVPDIEVRLGQYLGGRLSALNPDIDQAMAAAVLASDIELNAQGLSFWKMHG